MYKAIFSDGVLLETSNLKRLYHLAESARRTAGFYGQELLGYKLVNPHGKVILEIKTGGNVTLQEAEVSVRLYNVTMRTLQMKGLLEDGQRDITLNDLRKMVEAGHMIRARGCGTKTYIELFKTLRDYTGWGYELNEALKECVCHTPNGRHWLQTKGLNL